MNPVIQQICQRRAIPASQFFGAAKARNIVAARRDAIQRLSREGLGPLEIADETKLHVQTVYYWLSPRRRASLIAKSKRAFKIQSIGGKRQTKEQRREIVDAYLEDPAKGTALACSRGLSPLYAFKLVNALGLLPRKGET